MFMTSYQRFFSLAQTEVSLWTYCGEKPEYLQKTHLSNPLITNHLTCLQWGSNLIHSGESQQHLPLSLSQLDNLSLY